MDLRSIINTESASNSDSSPAENRPPAHERPSFAAPAPPATPYASSRDSFAASAPYNHPQPHHQPAEPLSSPYTPHSASAGVQQHSPQQSFAPKRSQSIQSVLSSDPAPSYPYHPKDHSPVAAPQPLPSQQFSPHAQGSLPGTPLGPPPAFARSSPTSVRPQSSGHESQTGQPPSSWVRQDSAHSHDQKPLVSPSTQSRPSWQDSKPVEQTPRHHSTASEKEHEETVSPRTVGTPRTRQGSSIGPADQAATLSARSHSHSEEQGWKQSPTRSLSHSSQQQSQQYQQPLVEPEDKGQSLPSQMDTTPDMTASPSSQPPQRKRRRFNEPPIYAQKSHHARGTGPVIKNPLPLIPKHMRNSPSNPWSARARSSAASVSGSSVRASSQGPLKYHAEETAPTNGPTVQAAPASAPVAPAASTAPVPQQPRPGSLGAWEPSVTGYIPHEDMTKLVCDFLFQHVVLRNDVGADPTGSSATGQGAIVEVEAKLGKHIDQDRRERLHLPVMTETVLNKENSRFRTSFESSMSLAQHRAMNNFLNDIVKAAMPNNNPGRIPLSYAHKKERDTFYEVPPSELPPMIRQNLNPRHRPRVRVTTDQRTGEILAKIVKVRIADLNVLSPRTFVDYRISVNLEMNFDGDVSHLPVVDTNSDGGKARDRNKDRMSYRHLAYQVDLTQVAKESMKNEFDHELEVEISADEIRRQGQLAMAGDPTNQYEDLVKGFLDNIRVLARAIPPQ